MAGNRESEQLTNVIHHMAPAEAQVSVHQVQNASGTKRHQIIIDIKQDIDIDEMSTRSLAESVMETLGARSAAVYIDNSQITGENSDLESLTTVNVIVANDLSQTTTQMEEDPPEPAESSGITTRAVERAVDVAAASTTETTTSTTISISTAATTTASGEWVLDAVINR